jgi:hypothetical protein
VAPQGSPHPPAPAAPPGPDDWGPDDHTNERIVGVGYEIRQIKDIDCVAQKFFADFSLTLKWYQEDLAHRPPGHMQADEVRIPPYYIANSVSADIRERDIQLNAEDPPGVVTMSTAYAGELSEFMELELFPLDVQDLTIACRVKEKGWKFKILAEATHRRIRETVELAEWTVYDPKIQVSVGKQGRCLYELKMVVSRKPAFYVWNVMCMVSGISTLAFFAFLFKAEDWDKRSNYIGMLLLTTVAFKFVVADALPKVSFFTIMDVYLFASFIVLLILIVQSAGIKFFISMEFLDEHSGRRVDVIFAIIVFASWGLMNLLFFRRFYEIEAEGASELGDPLPDIVTNHASAGAFGYVLGTVEIGGGDDEE